jgi:hypothetical protein
MTEEEKIDKTPVAQDIWCWSAKEKAYTWHVVVNHDANGYVDRVQCKVSKSVHKYKRMSGKAAKAPKKPTAAGLARAAAEAKSSAALEDVWFRGIKKWGDKPVPKYDPKQSFEAGDVVDHVTFGKGVVQKRRDTRIDVLFRNGVKVLPSPK